MEWEHCPEEAWACWAEDPVSGAPQLHWIPCSPSSLCRCSCPASEPSLKHDVGLTGYWQLGVLPSAALADTTWVGCCIILGGFI